MQNYINTRCEIEINVSNNTDSIDIILAIENDELKELIIKH
jgi:hypothetical protein